MYDVRLNFVKNADIAFDTLGHCQLTHSSSLSLDFSVYDPNLMVVDPSGFTLNGIRNYKQAFHLVHGIVNVFYCPEKSLLTFRMVYDCARNNIRVSWNAEVVPKAIFGGDRSMLHVDGISVYELNSAGKVRQHRVEHLMINDQPVETERGIFHALRNECQDADCIPAFVKAAASSSDDHFIARFQTAATPGTKSLFHVASTTTTTAVQALSTSSASNNSESGGDLAGLDRDALDRKNKTRKKFGLKALTPEEFMEIEAQVQQMGVDETIKQNQQAASNDAAEMPQQESKKKGGFLNNIFGQVFEDTCESNFDCKRPEICCDFGFKKQCCSSGAMVGNEMMPVRIPVTKDDGYMNGW
jgi:hypothetical protein